MKQLPPPPPGDFLAHLAACSLPASPDWVARAQAIAGLASHALRDIGPVRDELAADATVWDLVNTPDLRRIAPPPGFTVAGVSSLRVAIVRSVVWHRCQDDRRAAA